jgi:hypothetical protein
LWQMLNVIPMKQGILNFGILISFVKAWSKPIECCDINSLHKLACSPRSPCNKPSGFGGV